MNERGNINCSFVALDFETATFARDSICEIGLTFVENMKVVCSKSWLVKPYNNYYDAYNIEIHGITPEMTKHSPSFKKVWKDVHPLLENKIIVAHYSGFDMYALRDALDINEIEYPNFMFFCSCRAAKYTMPGLLSYSLNSVSEHLNLSIDLHHRAENDSLACAKIFIAALKASGASSLDDFQEKYGFKCGEFQKGYFRPQRAYVNMSLHGSRIRKKPKDIIGDCSKIDEGNYFFGKSVCFTGKCLYGIRDELLQKVADIGGIPVRNFTTYTDVLVVGQQDFRKVGEDGISKKQKLASKWKSEGYGIEVMSEEDFLRMFGKQLPERKSSKEDLRREKTHRCSVEFTVNANKCTFEIL